ncbi:response regulator [Myxacorys almedinensis]|uniref:histidine kinase n=1 Tax=Myxacorys almedinensis A TaxID=2690445 RepID=A0A8J8CHS9_9CYAN|nr:response regulator [Myxacorys almedinensis]NDJ15771.1 response regulator [Myxacorys almedinensis A]
MNAHDVKKQKLLVVDDEPDNLDLLYRTFHREFRVLKAESGPVALQLLEQEPNVAVIISDQRMPLMSGTEFLSLTAAKYPDIIRIILTGYTDVEDLVEAINSGKVFKYVTKPWDDEELKLVVRQAADTHNVLKARTQELRRTLRRETLLNAVTSTIRSALSYQEILQTIVEKVGSTLDASHAIIRSVKDGEFEAQDFNFSLGNTEPPVVLASTLWKATQIEVIQASETDDRIGQAGLRSVYQQAGICSSLIVPIVFQSELMAMLALHACGEPRPWQPDEVELLGMVADQAALALSQARAYEQVRALAKREALINTITTAIRSSLDPQKIFSAITQQLGQGLQVDGCALSLWSEGDEFVRCVGLHDASWQDPSEHDDLPQSTIPITENPVLQQLIATQQPVVMHSLANHPELDHAEFRSPTCALLVVPLLADGKIIGSISLRQNHHPRHWRGSEIQLAQSVAAQAAIAVQQSRLYQTTRQQAEKLIELDRQKTEFFQNISHEFRTPLTLMVGPLEGAVAQQNGLSYEQSTIALRNSRRLLRLVNQLLDLQRLNAGRMQPTFQACNLTDFVTQIVETFRAYCEKKGLTLSTELSECPPVYLDAEKFDKVLYNLLSNAMKFTPAGKGVTVALRLEGDQCILQVRDRGIGIREDQVPHLFERFRQAEGSANRSYEGTGLGLALVKELVELHGGQVHVESTYGEGTSFTICLQTGSAHLPSEQLQDTLAAVQPSRASVELADLETELQDFADSSDALPTPELVVPHTSDQPRILVVDDNPDLRSYVSGILRQQGYLVWTARNGGEGFEHAQTLRPSLIVTDLMMPKVSGLDLIRMLREQEDLKGIPVVLLTAKADEDTRIDGVERGADAYLSKPFNDRELLAEVRNLLSLKENEQRVSQLNTYLTESVLSRFLPPSLVQRAAKGELSLDLRPEPRMVTVLFSDIVGFTQLSNTLRSRRVAELLNEYLACMTRTIFANGGTVDKFMGDAILAIFGAPEELSPNEQVRRSIAAARQMYAALEDLNTRWEAQGISRVQFRCGIHQGTAVVGMFGGDERSDYTAIGPSVNIAARLQEAAQPGAILVSAAVADYLDEDIMTKETPLKLKGVDETVLTFSVNPYDVAALRATA